MAATLNLAPILEAAQRLGRRIRERFPSSGLANTADGVQTLARAAVDRTAAIQRPIYWLRVALVIFLAAAPFAVYAAIDQLDLAFNPKTLREFVAFFPAAVESLVFIGIGVIFLVTLESRIKRRRALTAVHELRELAHVVDMHQLDKDPVYFLRAGEQTASSPKRTMDAFELNRYLDYCSEMLSLIAKIGAIYGQRLADPVALDAVDRIEQLTTGLSRKIWQKVMVLERAAS